MMSDPPFLRLRPAPAPPVSDREPVSPHDTNVLSRLHALFSTHSPAEEVHHDSFFGRSKTEPVIPSPVISPGTFVDRDAIKVLVVTWNMGDALPKGDLSVLLGDVPQYTAPPTQSTSTIPSLPIENIHPYHIVVVAGQECPTDSGVPRGLGGGIMKGVHARNNHRKEKEEKKKAQEELNELVGTSLPGSEKEGAGDMGKGAQLETDEDGDEVDGRGNAASPSPNTPTLHKHAHATGTKGWSTMLDDWFCGPTREGTAIPPPSPNLRDAASLPTSGSATPIPMLKSPTAPPFVRSSTAPGSLSPTEPFHFPQRHLAAPPIGLSHSPLARSNSSSTSESSASSPDEDGQGFFPFPVSPNLNGLARDKGGSLPIKKDRPAIVIPNDEPERTRDGGKCYLHLVKERLMGMYLSVYVYKGCEHLIQGVDKDFVTAGLAGGRLGNKGGIGISVKLADHRFLFVNSHLAAHTARVSARLANIAKIKQELRLDCFLPKDDPRSKSEDLTDRFDSVFWCGDLNFRLDLSRLHAEWLVEQKKYSEALMWDQLKAAMSNPAKNPFVGFEEHTIDFPPTFKYDVWRSVKSTNRELKRSLRRRGTLDGKNARRPSAVEGSMNGLSHVLEADAEGNEELADEAIVERTDEKAQSDEDTRTIASRRSFESTAGGYTSAGPSTVGTDAEDEDFSTSVDASAYGSRHKALEVALKEKTKKFLSLVKMDKALSPSPSRKRLGRSSSKKVIEKASQNFEATSRRTSMSSIASLEPSMPIPEQAPRFSNSSERSAIPPLGPPRRPSDASFMSSSPNQPLGRKFSVLKRSISGRSSTQDGKSGDSHEFGTTMEDIDEGVDTREGVYDSSKKQRVPSWCDRVLWKTQITPDPEPNQLSPQHSHEEHKERGAFNRLSHAFSNFGGHLKLSMTRTASIDPHDRPNMHFDKTLPAVPIRDPAETLVASPEGSPSLHETKIAGGEALVPAPRRASPAKSPIHNRLVTRTRSGSGAAHPLLDANLVTASPPAFPKITFDPALPADGDRASQPTTTVFGRPRANSDSVPISTVSAIKRSLSSSSNTAIVHGDTPPRRIGQRSSSGGSLKLVPRTRSVDSPPTVHTTSLARPAAPQHLSTGQLSMNSHTHSHEDRNSIVRFFKDIPGWLHARSASHLEPGPTLRPPQPEFAGPKRHLKGEVECLHYGTIDDAAMRQLEGRSDHRPAIFAAAVYVGD